MCHKQGMSHSFFMRTRGNMPAGKHSPRVTILTAEEIARREADGQMKYQQYLRQQESLLARGAKRQERAMAS